MFDMVLNKPLLKTRESRYLTFFAFIVNFDVVIGNFEYSQHVSLVLFISNFEQAVLRTGRNTYPLLSRYFSEIFVEVKSQY